MPMAPHAKLSKLAKEISNVRQMALGIWDDVVDLGQLLVYPRTDGSRSPSIRAPTLSTYFTATDCAEDQESGIYIEDDSFVKKALDFFQLLPRELLFIVLSYLSINDVRQCLQVCRYWNILLSSEEFWSRLFILKFAQSSIPLGNLDYYTLYKNHHILNRNWRHSNYRAITLEGHLDSVYCAQLLDGDIVVTGSRDTTVRIWDVVNNKCKHVLKTHSGSVLCVSADKGLLVSGSSDATCCVFKLPSFECIYTLEVHAAGILDVQLSPDYVFTCSKDRSVAAWYRTTGTLAWKVNSAHDSAVNAMAVHHDSLFTAGGDGVIRQWDIHTGMYYRKYMGHTRGLACLKIDPKSNRLISGGNDRNIRIWDIASGECLMTLGGHRHLIRSLHIIGDRVVSASYDRTIRVWDSDGTCLAYYDGFHGSWIFSVCGNHKYIVSTSVGTKPVVLDFTAGLDSAFRMLI